VETGSEYTSVIVSGYGHCLKKFTNGKCLVSQIGGLAHFLEMTLSIDAATPMRGRESSAAIIA
jgi:hypothetical protein